MVIDVVICYEGGCETKQPGRWFEKPARAGVVLAASLEQIELFSPMNGRPPVGHPELVVNVIGVRPQGV